MHRLFQNLWLHIFTRITHGCEILEAGKFFPAGIFFLPGIVLIQILPLAAVVPLLALELHFNLVHLDALLFQIGADGVQLAGDHFSGFAFFGTNARAHLAVAGRKREGNGPQFLRMQLEVQPCAPVLERGKQAALHLLGHLAESVWSPAALL